MNEIEKKGIERLKQWLTSNNRNYKVSDKQTFDLIVDEKYAEVKTKGKPFSELDFISFTSNQQKQIEESSFKIFLVCNVSGEKSEIFEIDSSELLTKSPNEIKSYEYSKKIFQSILKASSEINIERDAYKKEAIQNDCDNVIAYIRKPNANQEIGFSKKQNTERLLDLLPEDGNEIIIVFPDFLLFSIFKINEGTFYVQSPKYLIDNDQTKFKITYKSLWGKLGFNSGDKLVLKVILNKRKYEYIGKKS
jgi:hypothetical protein